MLFFIDESGHPHPKDSTLRPVLSTVGVDVGELRRLGGAIHAVRRDVLQNEDIANERDFKAKAVFNTRTYDRKRPKWEYVEAIFDIAVELGVVSFHIVMERPTRELAQAPDRMPTQVFFLLQRVNAYMAKHRPEGVAIPVLDSQSHGADLKLSKQVQAYLYRTAKGRAWRMLPSPLFVDSMTMAGIQVVDLFASCVRQYHEISSGRVVRPPAYRRAIERLHNLVRSTVYDLPDPDAPERTLYGEFVMGPWRPEQQYEVVGNDGLLQPVSPPVEADEDSGEPQPEGVAEGMADAAEDVQ